MNAWATTGSRKLKYLLVGGDLVLLLAGMVLAASTRERLGGPDAIEVIAAAGVLPIIALLGGFILVFYIFSLYDLDVGRMPIRSLLFVTIAIVSGLVLAAALFYFMNPGTVLVGRTVLVSHAVFSGIGVYLWRLAFAHRVLGQWPRRRVGILAAPAEYSDLASQLETADALPPHIVRVIPLPGGEYGGTPGDGSAYCGPSRPAMSAVWSSGSGPQTELAADGTVAVGECAETFDLSTVAKRERLDCLVCSIRRHVPEALIRRAISLRKEGINVCDFPSFYSDYSGRIPVAAVDAQWILGAIHQRRQPAVERVRRIADVVVSTLLLALAAPVMLLIGLATKLSSPGPIIFVQERLGLGERPFRCYKFRTMVWDAEEGSPPRWAEAGDARTTTVGRLLRQTRLDELPQLMNVLRGDMSMVGFRPIRRHFADMLDGVIPFYRLRFDIKPGLTGWPQVRYGYAGSVEQQREKFEYELFYLANRSLLLDCYIAVKTLQVILFGRGQ